MKCRKKIVFLTYIPSPYRVDFFNELKKHCNLLVIYYCSKMPNSPWLKSDKVQNYKNKVLFEESKITGLFNLIKLLHKNRTEIIVIGGYSMLAEIISIFYLKLFRVKFVLNSDGGFITKGFFKTLVKKFLIQSASYWLSSGINTTKTLINYGAKSSAIFEYHFSSLFKKDLLKDILPNEIINDLRNELKLKKDVNYLIFVGQLVQRKGVDILLEAIKNVKSHNFEVLIVGSGDQEEILIDNLGDLSIKNKVHFLGKLPKEQVLKYLKVSDVFVFPSREDIWGLVLNEAVSSGLPIISSRRVGAAFSLIKDGVNGYIVNTGNVIELSNAIEKILNKDLRLMSNESLNIAVKFTIEQMVEDHLVLFDKISLNPKNNN